MAPCRGEKQLPGYCGPRSCNGSAGCGAREAFPKALLSVM